MAQNHIFVIIDSNWFGSSNVERRYSKIYLSGKCLFGLYFYLK
jgi:hypothetical protein